MISQQVYASAIPIYEKRPKKSALFRAASASKASDRAERQVTRRRFGDESLDAAGVTDPMARAGANAALGNQAIQKDAQEIQDYRNGGGMDPMNPYFRAPRGGFGGRGGMGMPQTMPLPGSADPMLPTQAERFAPTAGIADFGRGGGATPDPSQPIFNLNTGLNNFADGSQAGPVVTQPNPAAMPVRTARNLNGIALAPDEVLDPITGKATKRIGRRDPMARSVYPTTPLEDSQRKDFMGVNKRMTSALFR